MAKKISWIGDIPEPRIDKKIQGKKNRASGKAFEKKVREDLESQGWIIVRWGNQVDLENNKIVPVKPKFSPFTHSIMYTSTGFPDYLAMKKLTGEGYEVMGVECKGGDKNKYLDKEEKEKCKWLLDHKIFSRILIAQRGEVRGEIKYTIFNAYL